MSFYSKLPSLFEAFLLLIIVVKIVFLYAIIRLKIAQKNNDTKNIAFYHDLKEITHNLFFILMSVLIVYLFRPHALYPKPVVVDGETKTFLFVFALLTLAGIDYKGFFTAIKHNLK